MHLSHAFRCLRAISSFARNCRTAPNGTRHRPNAHGSTLKLPERIQKLHRAISGSLQNCMTQH
eukprot:10255194-Alexandrium_andersonii.AAC.1